jgi:hypothetical protein
MAYTGFNQNWVDQYRPPVSIVTQQPAPWQIINGGGVPQQGSSSPGGFQSPPPTQLANTPAMPSIPPLPGAEATGTVTPPSVAWPDWRTWSQVNNGPMAPPSGWGVGSWGPEAESQMLAAIAPPQYGGTPIQRRPDIGFGESLPALPSPVFPTMTPPMQMAWGGSPQMPAAPMGMPPADMGVPASNVEAGMSPGEYLAYRTGMSQALQQQANNPVQGLPPWAHALPAGPQQQAAQPPGPPPVATAQTPAQPQQPANPRISMSEGMARQEQQRIDNMRPGNPEVQARQQSADRKANASGAPQVASGVTPQQQPPPPMPTPAPAPQPWMGPGASAAYDANRQMALEPLAMNAMDQYYQGQAGLANLLQQAMANSGLGWAQLGSRLGQLGDTYNTGRQANIIGLLSGLKI